MTLNTRKSLIALFLSFVLIFSLFTVATLADDTTEAATEGTVEVVSGEAATADKTEANTEAGNTTTTGATTTEKSSEEATEEHEHESETADTSVEDAVQAELAATQKTLIINGIIIAAIIVILVVVGIKFKSKLGDFFRAVKSERKKIVWSSKENTRKSFLVVVIVVVAIAILIGLFDFAFDIGINGLSSLFN